MERITWTSTAHRLSFAPAGNFGPEKTSHKLAFAPEKTSHKLAYAPAGEMEHNHAIRMTNQPFQNRLADNPLQPVHPAFPTGFFIRMRKD